MKVKSVASRGGADKITGVKFWGFWSAECGYESRATCVLQMGRKAIGPVCCVMHVKDPSALVEKRIGSPPCSPQPCYVTELVSYVKLHLKTGKYWMLKRLERH